MQKFTRILLTIVCSAIFAMWVYAFGFSSRESINRIGDDAWKARAEAHCKTAQQERLALEDLTEMDPEDRQALRKKADLVAKATDSMEAAIDRIAADVPSDEKGRAIVPQWIAEYRIYIQNRREFVDQLRVADRRPYFSEKDVEGVPITERLRKFARENDMRSCQPPFDLSV